MTPRRTSAARTPAPARASERRPAAPARRLRSGGNAAATSRSRFTTRATILALVLCALALSLAYPMREFLAQRADIAELRAQNEARQADVAGLQADLRQWEDPAYVKTQAQRRLQFAMPGDYNLVVVESDPGHRTAAKAGTAAAAADKAWYSDLWGTVRAADAVPKASQRK